MVLSNEKINDVVSYCASKGHSIRVRDISYLALCQFYEDRKVAYKAIFGDDYGYETYANDESVKFLEKYMRNNVFEQSVTRKSTKKEDDITFEENKAYMLKLKKDTEAAMEAGDIEKKDGLKILADISVKLNDKFSVNDTNQEQLVIVNTKYTDICPHCNHECSPRPMSMEEAMKMYDLVEKT